MEVTLRSRSSIRVLTFITFLMWLAGTSACSTSSPITTSKTIYAPNVFLLSRPVPESLSLYEPQFVAVMEEFGLSKGQSDDPQALVLSLDFNPNPFYMQVTATVRQNDEIVATGEATIETSQLQ